MSNWRESFEQNKHTVGRAVHESWAAEKVRQGFADHAFLSCEEWAARYRLSDTSPCWAPGMCHVVEECSLPREKHHTDMLDYDDLAPHIQAYDIETGIVGFRMGYEAAEAAEAAL